MPGIIRVKRIDRRHREICRPAATTLSEPWPVGRLRSVALIGLAALFLIFMGPVVIRFVRVISPMLSSFD